jgi:chromate transporter
VILNLAIWFALHVVFREVITIDSWGLNLALPNPASVDWAAAGLAVAALLAVFRFRVGTGYLLAGAALAGLLLHFVR